MGDFVNKSVDYDFSNKMGDFDAKINSSSFVYSNSSNLNNSDVEEVDFDTEKTSTESGDTKTKTDKSATDTLTSDDLEWFKGKMSDKEYDDFVDSVEKYYDDSISQNQGVLDKVNGLLDRLKSNTKIYKEYYGNESLNEANDDDSYGAYGSAKNNILEVLYKFVQDKKYEGTGVTREQIEKMSVSEKIEYICKHSTEAKEIKDNWDKVKKETADPLVKKNFSDLGINTLEEYMANVEQLEATKIQLEESIKTAKKMKKSAYYDNLQYLKDYSDYNEHTITDEEREFVKKKMIAIGNAEAEFVYDYNKFHDKFPNTSPMDFVKILQELYPKGNYSVNGVEDEKYIDNLKTIAAASDKLPNLTKVYNYLYSKDPEKAKQYLEDTQYELNNIEGQIRANRFLNKLGKEDGDNDVLEAIANELGVSAQGLADGLDTFKSGVGYSFEALCTTLGIIGENRMMSADEYKKMYILYGLLDEDSKIKAGLIQKDENGNITNVNDSSIIDYTQKYSGVLLSNNYEISQGIGNMLPSVALSYACPIAGSVAMGVSAGGNAYHDAMVNGDSLFSSIMYGAFTGCSEAISERILGGLPGLSEVQVTSFKTYAKAMGKEFTQEAFQGIMDASYRALLMGEELPTTAEGWKEFGADILKQGVYGAVTAVIMQAPALGTSLYSKFKFNKNIKTYHITDTAQQAAIDYLKRTDSTGKIKKMTDEQIIANYGNQLFEISRSYSSPMVTQLMNDEHLSYEEASNKVKAYVNTIGTPEEVSQKFEKGKMTAQEVLDYFQNGYAVGAISDEQATYMFSKLVGDNIASWSPSPAVSSILYQNLLSACANSNISFGELSQSFKVLDAVKDYYEDAKGLKSKLQSNTDAFDTYRTHGIVHIMDVLTMSINSAKSFADSGVSGMNYKSIMLTAIMHDTGMSGGKQLVLSTDANGKLKIEAMDVQMDGNNVRESHSYNSGLNIISQFDTLSKMGYTDAEIAEAALLAFAHSKSNSGLNPLTNNPAGWSFAIHALLEGSDDVTKTKFLNGLVAAGIITSTQTSGSNDVTVKAPKRYKTDADGKIILDKKGKPIVDESCYARDENGNIKYDEKGKPIVQTKFKGKVDLYQFNESALLTMAYEALAVRIGDAFTNNDNGEINQFGGKIIIDEKVTHYENAWGSEKVMDAMKKLSKNPISGDTTIDNLIDSLRSTDNGLRNAASAETKHSRKGNSVVFKVESADGKTRKTYNKSQEFVLGEHNQTYNVSGSADGVNAEITVRDSNAIPFCTLFAIEERVGELKSFAGDVNAVDGAKPITLTIKLASDTKPSVRKLYEQYAESCAKDGKIKVVIES